MRRSPEGQFGARLFERFRHWSAKPNPKVPDQALDQFTRAMAEGHISVADPTKLSRKPEKGRVTPLFDDELGRNI